MVDADLKDIEVRNDAGKYDSYAIDMRLVICDL
jgi:hypothetical protein